MRISRYSIFALAIFWIAGLVISLSLPLNNIGCFMLIILSLSSIFLSLFFYYKKRFSWFLFLALAIFLFGIVRMGIYQDNHKSFFTEEIIKSIDEPIGVRGYIVSDPIIDGNVVKLTIEPQSYLINNEEVNATNKEYFLTYIYLDSEGEKSKAETLKNGMGIRVYGDFEKPMKAKNPGQFNYQQYLNNRAIYWKINVTSFQDVTVTNSSQFNSVLSYTKNKIANVIDELFTNPYSGFIKALILGDRGNLAETIEDDFSILGLSHLLAISGLHLSILAGMLFWLLTRLRVTRERASLVISIILIFYMFLTGLTASVVRATVMSILLLFSFGLKRKIASLQILGLAFILMTLYKPNWIFDVGFQLSFIVTFSILWAFPLVKQRLRIKNDFLKNSLSLVIVTQIASIPLVFYYFHQYSLLSIIANLIIVPIFSMVILPLGLIIVLLGLFNLYVANILAILMSKILELLFKLFQIAGDFTSFHFYGNLSIGWLILIYLIAIWIIIRPNVKFGYIRLAMKQKLFKAEKILLLILLVTLLLSFYFPDNQGLVTVIDVGQGDSILIETPKNHNILVDSGGSYRFNNEEWKQKKNTFDVGDDVILPYLHYQGIKKLDLAILTHEDLDHIGGYLSLVDNIKIDTFIVTEEFPRTELGKELNDKLVANNIKIVKINKATNVLIDEYTVLTIYPVNLSSSDKENDHTLVTALNMYNTKIMFSADLEAGGEAEIINNYDIIDADIVKIGHHGSKTSSTVEWLEALNAEEAVISVGANNLYGHPSDKVLNRLEESKLGIWRTDEDGAILINVSAKGYKIDSVINNNSD